MKRLAMDLQTFAGGRAAGEKIERKYLAHFIDASFGAASASYQRIGKDLEEYSIELNPDIETKKNILGETSNTVKGYEPQSEVDTFYCLEDDPMFTKLYAIVNERSTGSQLYTTVVDVLIDSDGSVVDAYREDVVVIPKSIGGDNGGMQIPYSIKYNGNRVSGTWDNSAKTFTVAGAGA